MAFHGSSEVYLHVELSIRLEGEMDIETRGDKSILRRTQVFLFTSQVRLIRRVTYSKYLSRMPRHTPFV